VVAWVTMTEVLFDFGVFFEFGEARVGRVGNKPMFRLNG